MFVITLATVAIITEELDQLVQQLPSIPSAGMSRFFFVRVISARSSSYGLGRIHSILIWIQLLLLQKY